MRKALVAALVVAFVLSIAATASAAVLTPASFPDVQGQACADAVAKLEALGIGKGIDGKWMPELPVTRAQFAAFAVRLLGLEGVVKYMAGPTKFADVPATHWASGYVNVAVAKKLLAGYPDGNFHPDENITFPQAATVLGRVLGYVNLPGEWPSNYMVVASENGLFEGVEFGGDFVTRGDMAIMLWNALTAQVVQYKYYSDLGIWDYEKQWDDQNKTDATLLLEKALGAKLLDAQLTSNADVDSSLTGSEVKLDGTKYTMPSGVDTAAILGHSLSTIAKGTAVRYAEDVTESDSIVQGTLTANATATNIQVDDNDYTLDGAATVFVNKAKVTGDVYLALLDGMDVTAFLNKDGKVAFVVGFKWDVSDDRIAAVSTTNKTITVGSSVYNIKANTTIKKNGAAASLAELAKDQIVYVALARGASGAVSSDALYVAAYDSTVSGTVTGVRLASGGARYIKIGDTEYKVSAKATATLDGQPKTLNELAQLLNYTATVMLNKDNQARVITGTTVGIIGLYAGLTEDGKSIKVNVKGNVVTAPLATDVTVPGTVAVGDVVIAKTDASGKVKSVTELTEVETNAAVRAVSASAGKITVGALYTVYSVSADAGFLTPSGSYVTLSEVKVGDTVSLYWTGSGGILFGKVNPTATIKVYGKYLGYMQSESGVVAYFDVKGSTVSHEVYGAVVPGLDPEDFGYATVRADGKFEGITELTAPATDLDNAKIVVINDNGTLTVVDDKGTSDTADDVYNVVDPSKASLYDTAARNKAPIQVSDLKVGDKIDVYKDGTDVVVIQRVELAP